MASPNSLRRATSESGRSPAIVGGEAQHELGSVAHRLVIDLESNHRVTSADFSSLGCQNQCRSRSGVSASTGLQRR